MVNCFFASPPQLFSAMFDNSAARVLITFDRDTDKTISLFNPKEVQLRGRDSCAKILREGPALLANVTTPKWLGADSICYFVNPSVLAAQCGPGASVLPWDTLEIVPDRIRSCATSFESTTGNCAVTVLPLSHCAPTVTLYSHRLTAPGTVMIKPPLVPPVPTVDLIGVSKLGVCEHAILDAGISTGGGGRPLRYHWRILAALQGNALEKSRLQFVQLSDKNSTTLQTQLSGSSELDLITIEGDLRYTPLPPGLTYIFQVGVMNYMNISSCYYDEELNDPHCKSQGVLMMYKSELAIPQLFIDGKARREVIRPTDLILAASSAPSRCGSGGAIVFSWSYTAAPGPEVMWPDLDEKTRGTRNLRIKKGTLVVFQTYTLRLRGRMEVL